MGGYEKLVTAIFKGRKSGYEFSRNQLVTTIFEGRLGGYEKQITAIFEGRKSGYEKLDKKS